MILVIDIGNTNVVLGIFKGKKLHKCLRIPANVAKNGEYYKRVILKFVGNQAGLSQIKGVAVSSVVPKISKAIKQALASSFDLKPFILGENVKVPIRNLYTRPSQVGQDRLINAFAALSIYKRKPLIIVDFGTAVTIDVVSKRGAYLGGVIAPGVELSIENLTSRAALLPRINLKVPKDILGKSTSESMLSGIFYGYASLCDGIVEKLQKRLKSKVLVIATGGHSKLLSRFCRKIDKIDSQLTLKGLNLLCAKMSKNSQN